MKTVPSLCATATVVGASAVGLSFGRETPSNSSPSAHPNPNTNTKEAAPARPLPANFMPVAMPTTAPSFGGPVPVAPSSHVPLATRPSQNALPQRRMVRRMTSDDVPALPLSGGVSNYAPSDLSISEADTPRYPPTRRGSWLKRLSSISISSSRTPSPAPLSPAVSCPHGAMAFSHDGSAASIFGRRSTSPSLRNRLVKRSSSIRRADQLPAQGTATLRPSFRRPATSHQRTAALYASHSLNNNNEAQPHSNPAEDLATNRDFLHSADMDSQFEYAQYFTAKVTKERTVSKKRGSTSLRGSYKRVVPDEKHLPTLVLARSVAAATPELDDSTSDEGDSVFSVSRPGTPFSIAAFATKESTHTGSRPSIDDPEDALRTKRSSFTDFLSFSKKQLAAAGASGTTILRRASQRVNSAPLVPTMQTRPHSTSYGESHRHVVEPALAAARRAIATSAGTTEAGSAGSGFEGGASSTPLPTLAARRASAGMVPVLGLASMPQQLEGPSAALGANQAPPSPTLAQSGVRVSRHSMAPSEQASTLVGSSDNELRALGFGDDDNTDVQSETCFDSLRTGATRSTSGGARGPRIETIFDESPPSKIKVTALRDLLPPGALGDHAVGSVAGHQSIAEEEENITTPVRMRHDCPLHDSPSCARARSAPLFPNTVSASPPSMPKPLSLGTLEWDSRPENDDDDSSRWSLEETDAEDPWVDAPTVHHRPTATLSPFPQSARRVASGPTSKPTTPHHLTTEFGDRDTRSSIFDWSEQQLADKNSGNCTPPRPRTVHGKKDADRRGSRSVGRRIPSGLHARSQSVPVVPDLTGKRNTVVTNKFGTWGVGSKGVTEDWNDDFDFTELNGDPIEEGDASPRVDSGTSMVVPKSIQEQQNNVLANIGLLREWGLLIEELKEHRTRAQALGIVDGPHASTWEEVDAMIDLADQEAGHQDVAPASPPSTPGFDDDSFEEPPASPSLGRGRGQSENPDQDIMKSRIPSPRSRKSILPPNDDIFAPQPSPRLSQSISDTDHEIREAKPAATRPRKDSEAKARSVIEALQKRRSVYEPILDTPPTPSSKKVPFDTATLRRIVPYVSSLTHKVKDMIRDAEGLYSSPLASPMQEQPQRDDIFQPDADLVAQMKLMTVM
ncbi:hypothetical protein COCMIDRAFT_40418 [Bipolaris oryzae ATCC 44560]|uniref:Uncharacterized protein n=1 Tax=Bipolaris oryzae ATCC 44560 TaxID=930090 RepID=W6YV43_COCMI|nr:uncharacterized protein COCMIDRAFT_40418 [Bipolaris oryzae ATCC 44560]EUC41415.1 hypothetical protein COCMIDRAFT_40418 [Bipolaris oryzae ATCC 44560]